MRRTGSGWDRSFFLAVRKRRPRPRSLTEEGGAAGDPSLFDAFVPLLLAALPAAFFIACGRPNQERSSLPVLTVLPLLAGEHLEEGDGVEKTRVQDLWEWETPRGLFLSSQKVPADVLVEVLVEMLVDFVPNSPRKSYPDLKSANTLSVSSRFKGLLRTRFRPLGRTVALSSGRVRRLNGWRAQSSGLM